MILATYNLRSGGTGRFHWAKVLEEFRPDIFLVQETVTPQEHLPPCATPRWRSFAWRRAEGSPRKRRLRRLGQVRPLDLPDFHGHVVGVEVTGSGGPEGGRRCGFQRPRPGWVGYQKAMNAILDIIADPPRSSPW